MEFSVQFDGLEEVVVTHMEDGKKFTPSTRFDDLEDAYTALRKHHKIHRREYVVNNPFSAVVGVITSYLNECKERDYDDLGDATADLCDLDEGGFSDEIRRTLSMEVGFTIRVGNVLAILLMANVKDGVLVTVKFSNDWETFDISLQEGSFCLSAPKRKE